MTVKDLKEWIKMLPEELDDCQLVFREIMQMDDDDPTHVAGDDPIVSCSIDMSTRELCFYNCESQKLIDMTNEI